MQEREKSLVVKKTLQILSRHGYGGRVVYVPLFEDNKDKKEKYGVKKRRIKKLLKKGLPPSEVARKVGASTQYVWRIARNCKH